MSITGLTAFLVLACSEAPSAPAYELVSAARDIGGVDGSAVTLEPLDPTIEPGSTVQLYYSGGSGKTNWQSNNREVATVDQAGLVTGRSPGTAVIKASSKVGKAETTVTVSPGRVVRVGITPAAATLQAGEQLQLSAAAYAEGDYPVNSVVYTWASSNQSVATVSANGLVTAVAAGAAAITASSANGVQGSTAITVTAPLVITAVEITSTDQVIEVGKSAQLAAVALSGDQPVAGASIEWSSSNPAVATVSKSGLVTGVAAGTAVMTASASGQTDVVTITVAEPAPLQVQSLTVSPATASVAVGQSLQLSASATYSDGSPVSAAEISWTSSNPAIATVDAAGWVTGVAAGSAQITAAAGTRSASSLLGVTEAPAEPPPESPSSGAGIWIGTAEVQALPMSGAAWDGVKARADSDCGPVDLANQDQNNNVCIMAKALVYVRTGVTSYRDDVVAALGAIASSGTYSGRALALGRELAAYVIAADLVNLRALDGGLDARFRAKLAELLTTPTIDGPTNLVTCHEQRPNNWGTHCGASRIAVAAYLGDTAELARAARVFYGWLGDRAQYAGFSYGDLSWQCDPAAPVGINPAGCLKQGHSIDGVLPDDQRRGGTFTWPPPQENYVYEALQGALAQAQLLARNGHPGVWSASDKALLRAFQWLHTQASFPASGDDRWEPHLVNKVYRTSFPAPLPSQPGKNVGWTEWTHQ